MAAKLLGPLRMSFYSFSICVILGSLRGGRLGLISGLSPFILRPASSITYAAWLGLVLTISLLRADLKLFGTKGDKFLGARGKS